MTLKKKANAVAHVSTTSAHSTRIAIAHALVNLTDTASDMWQILNLFARNGKGAENEHIDNNCTSNVPWISFFQCIEKGKLRKRNRGDHRHYCLFGGYIKGVTE